MHRGNRGENKHADDAEAGEKVCVGRGFSDVKQWGSFDLDMFRRSYIWYVTGIHHDFSSYHHYLWLWVGQKVWFVWQSVIWKAIKPSESERCTIFIPPLEQCPQDYYTLKKPTKILLVLKNVACLLPFLSVLPIYACMWILCMQVLVHVASWRRSGLHPLALETSFTKHLAVTPRDRAQQHALYRIHTHSSRFAPSAPSLFPKVPYKLVEIIHWQAYVTSSECVTHSDTGNQTCDWVENKNKHSKYPLEL